ncbi:LytR/AlgR family response regulator transcription factor [Arthrospiribacter ruber]|uniref:DNA-binding response regulator n=1 Tax=Arthrospiribacter ruber TaxID=2487934 RepID=A0A951MEA1_9BACT|nr:LytTR family DNA-binding domain-containing protein [Arthrospiribacter ruber]MBW3468325.1 DNA-binding response regulator [Arthrospiribacter ruber]
MKLTCYIIDDEPLATEVIASYIVATELIELKGIFLNPLKAFQAIHDDPVDLIFLDIQMPKISGLDFIKSLKNPPAVILTTAYREFALQGFELDVVDYLLKPIPFERFLKAVDKVQRLTKDYPLLAQDRFQDEFLYFQKDKVNYKFVLKDIIFIESQRDYSRIISKDGEIKILQKISELEGKLKNKGFLRVHRSYIVNLDLVDRWCSFELGINGRNIPIGRSYYKMVAEKLNR